MTKEEHLAHRHLVGTAKATRGLTDVASQTEARKNASPVYRDMLSNDPDVLGLTSEGLDAFVERVAQRILGTIDMRSDSITVQNAVLCTDTESAAVSFLRIRLARKSVTWVPEPTLPVELAALTRHWLPARGSRFSRFSRSLSAPPPWPAESDRRHP